MDLDQLITDRILNQLEADVVPWRKTWVTGTPKSRTTGRAYRGINLLLLGTSAYTSRYWVTFREALRLDGHVRKGEKASPVVYWKWRTPEEIQRLEAKTGKEIAPCYPFLAWVFNLDQVDGVTRPEDDVPQRRNQCLEAADRILAEMPAKPEIDHAVVSEPVYNPRTDRVRLPHLSQFENAEEYYATLFHELVHATGHSKRLDRFAESSGDVAERYSFEELVAEFGAAFLCGFAGISNTRTEELQASYIKNWAEVLRNDKRMVLRAASAAQRAADFIRCTSATPGLSPVSPLSPTESTLVSA